MSRSFFLTAFLALTLCTSAFAASNPVLKNNRLVANGKTYSDIEPMPCSRKTPTPQYR